MNARSWVAGVAVLAGLAADAGAGPNVKKSTWGTFAASIVVSGSPGSLGAGSVEMPPYECPAGQIPLLLALTGTVAEVGTIDARGGFSGNAALPMWGAWKVVATMQAQPDVEVRGDGSETAEIRLDAGRPLPRNGLIIVNIRQLPAGVSGAVVQVHATVACGTAGLQPAR